VRTLVFAGLIAAAAVLAYADSFRVPLLLDDVLAIKQNASIRHLWPLSAVFRTPEYSGTSGRPLLNLSFALNYAAGGEKVGGYHAVNFVLLLLSGLTLMGIVRRALRSARFNGRYDGSADWLAAIIAVLWTVHPLLTESVTYISERAEVLMGLFYLLTLYCLVRYASPTSSDGLGSGTRQAFRALPRGQHESLGGFSQTPSEVEGRYAIHQMRWDWLSIACCWLGMATKEVMATAPLMVFCFDAIFVAGSATAAWRARRIYYSTLAASWLLLAALMLGLGKHSVGYQQGVGTFEYLLTECQAIARYLQLAIWPAPLVFDYGPQLVSHPLAVWPEAALILFLLGGTAVLLRRAPAAAFLGLWFFFILAPTSSFIPVALQPIAENRMYLPLAAIVAGLVLVVHHRLGKWTGWFFGVIILLFVLVTAERNATYATERSIWADTVAKRPHNARALDNYGNTLMSAGQLDQAIHYYRAALALTPKVGRIHYNLGKALHAGGHNPEAIAEYQLAVQLEPGFADGHINLATALAEAGRPAEARAELGRALRLNSSDADSHYNFGLVLFRSGRLADALDQYQRALQLDPSAAPTRDALATTLFRLGRPDESIREYEALLREQPRYAPAENNLGNVLLAIGRPEAARPHFEHALKLNPEYSGAHTNLGLLELQQGRLENAQSQFETAIRLDPSDAEARFELGNVMGMKGNMPAAMAQWSESLRIQPNNPEAENNLAMGLSQQGKTSEAITHLEAALRINPNYEQARANLQELRAQAK